MLKGYQLVNAIPPWYSPVHPKPVYQDDKVTAYGDVPVFAEHLQVRANRVDTRFVDRENKEVMLIEMSAVRGWITEKQKEGAKKTLKYAPLRLELKRQHPGFTIRFNIVIDALGGYSRILKEEVKTLVGSDRCREVLRRMQKAVLSHTPFTSLKHSKSCAGHLDTFGTLMRQRIISI